MNKKPELVPAAPAVPERKYQKKKALGANPPALSKQEVAVTDQLNTPSHKGERVEFQGGELMENTNTDILQKEALFLYDQGIPVFLSDPVTKRGIGRYSGYDPITDRELLISMCEENPGANLEICMDREGDLIALGVGYGFWEEKGNDSFEKLSAEYGVPDTIAYLLPSGQKLYFFRPDSADFNVEEISGQEILKGNDPLFAYPSVIDGQQVVKIGTATTVQNLSDWLAGNGKTEISAEKVSEPPSEKVEIPSSEHKNVSDGFTEEEKEIPQTIAGVGEEADTDPCESLRMVVSDLITSKKDKNEILAQALEWNSGKGFPVKIEDIVNLVEELGETTTSDVEALFGEDLLFKLAEETILFHDDLTEPYFHFEGEPFKAPSKEYGAQLAYRYYKKTGKMPKAKQLKNVLDILGSLARFEGQRVILKNRVSAKDGAFFYDLRNKNYLKVTSEKWEIIPTFPLFRRYQHQQPQVEPISGGDPWEVFDFLTVDEENRLLVMVYLISLFVPRIAHPVFAVFGDQGSAKSFLCTVINRLVDPTLTERIIQPKNERDLIQTLKQKYVTVFDNQSNINDRVSDIFCQTCTGAAISNRTLYTDEGENIAQFRHVIILNSISLAIVNADLMDRSIILRCHRIDPQDRKAEEELWEAFEAARPSILGGVFDTLVKAMEIYPNIKIDRLPRLADFAKWGFAIAEALGKSGDQFIEDFSQNIKRQNESVAEKNVLCQTVIQLMSDNQTYLKTVGDAHKALKNIAREDAKDATFPKLPHNLRERLERLRSTLAEHNIHFQFIEQRTNTGVKILFTKNNGTLEPETTFTKPESSEPGVAGEAQNEIPEVEFDEIPEVVNE